MAVPGIPENVLNTMPLLQTLNQTPLAILPQELQQLIQGLVSIAYVTVGGIFGVFIISILLRWWQNRQLNSKFSLILEKLEEIDKKLPKKSR